MGGVLVPVPDDDRPREEWLPTDTLPSGQRRCMKKSAATGKRCKNPSMRAMDACLRHSGLSLADARKKSKAALVALQDPYIERLRVMAADPHTEDTAIIQAAKLIFDKSLVADETEARIDVEKTRMMAIALGRALDALSLSEADKERAAQVMFAELRQIAAPEDS